MAFSEAIKQEVKRKAAFRCCRCQQIGVEVHHILPEKDGVPDDMNNAAPLCPNCHGYFGDNPTKRKEITQMRDWWYEVAKTRYPTEVIGSEKLDEINNKLGEVQKGLSDVAELKTMLRPLWDILIEDITPSTASAAASGIVDTMVSSTAGGRLFGIVICNSCGAEVMGTNYCPNCGIKIRK